MVVVIILLARTRKLLKAGRYVKFCEVIWQIFTLTPQPSSLKDASEVTLEDSIEDHASAVSAVHQDIRNAKGSWSFRVFSF